MGIIELEEGWSYMMTGVSKIALILEGNDESFEAEQYMNLYRYVVLYNFCCLTTVLYCMDTDHSGFLCDIYSTIYNMCVQKPPNDYSEQLYYRYRQLIEDYAEQMVECEEPKFSFGFDSWIYAKVANCLIF